jgi:hypothetical protein
MNLLTLAKYMKGFIEVKMEIFYLIYSDIMQPVEMSILYEVEFTENSAPGGMILTSIRNIVLTWKRFY